MSLSETEIALLREVLERQAPRMLALLPSLQDGSIGHADRTKLCEVITSEFAETGLDGAYEPTTRGRNLERLLDVVNRPNLRLDHPGSSGGSRT